MIDFKKPPTDGDTLTIGAVEFEVKRVDVDNFYPFTLGVWHYSNENCQENAKNSEN